MNFILLSTFTLATILYNIQHGVLSLGYYAGSLLSLCVAGFNILIYIITPNKLTGSIIIGMLFYAIYQMP